MSLPHHSQETEADLKRQKDLLSIFADQLAGGNRAVRDFIAILPVQVTLGMAGTYSMLAGL